MMQSELVARLICIERGEDPDEELSTQPANDDESFPGMPSRPRWSMYQKEAETHVQESCFNIFDELG